MGRGRQKAKQTKVARELKYFSPQTDYSQLERELRGDTTTDEEPDPWAPADDIIDDNPYAGWEDVAEV